MLCFNPPPPKKSEKVYIRTFVFYMIMIKSFFLLWCNECFRYSIADLFGKTMHVLLIHLRLWYQTLDNMNKELCNPSNTWTFYSNFFRKSIVCCGILHIPQINSTIWPRSWEPFFRFLAASFIYQNNFYHKMLQSFVYLNVSSFFPTTNIFR